MGEATNDNNVDYFRCVYVHDLDKEDWEKVVNEFAHDILFELKTMQRKLRFFLYNHYKYFHHPVESVLEIDGAIDDLSGEMQLLFEKSKEYCDLAQSTDYRDGVQDWSDDEWF